MKKVNLATDKEEFIKRYRATIKRSGADKLLAYLLRNDFFTAPASVRNHLAEPGGLCRHSLNVDDALTELITTPDTMWYQYAQDHKITRETCAIIGLLHDLCKVNFYVQGYKNQKNYNPDAVDRARKAGESIKHDARGDFFWEEAANYEIEDKFPIGHGEKSVYIISQFLKLTRDEILAIRWHMAFTVAKDEWPALNGAMDLSPLVIATHLADLTATHLMEKEINGYESIAGSLKATHGDEETEATDKPVLNESGSPVTDELPDVDTELAKVIPLSTPEVKQKPEQNSNFSPDGLANLADLFGGGFAI